MDIDYLSEADKYLLYGLLLKKRRSSELDRKALAIVRSRRTLDEKIEAILNLGHAPDLRRGRSSSASPAGVDGTQPPGQAQTQRRNTRSRRRRTAVVIDLYPEVTRLLSRCSLKRALTFTRVGESLDALYLLRRPDVRLLIVNESLPAEECVRYYEICRAIEPQVRIIYLLAPPELTRASREYRRHTRFVPKPIDIDLLDRTARELLGL
ncbi:MAG: hypothetical protein JW820_16135 [Spirochaetales bacterium]|nr:hypothetical protein [Spirochaetales bacterium]